VPFGNCSAHAPLARTHGHRCRAAHVRVVHGRIKAARVQLNVGESRGRWLSFTGYCARDHAGLSRWEPSPRHASRHEGPSRANGQTRTTMALGPDGGSIVTPTRSSAPTSGIASVPIIALVSIWRNPWLVLGPDSVFREYRVGPEPGPTHTPNARPLKISR